MNKRNRNYIILAAIIVTEFLVVRILNDLGIPIVSEFIQVIGCVIFYLPIIGLLLYLSKDPRIKKHWKIILRILIIYILLAFVIGTILSLFINM